MHRYEFQLRITAEQFLDYYRGAARNAVARCDDGRTLQFPAALLQRFVTPEGIQGRFALICDENHQHPRLEKL